jgi:hypothetical protein
LKKNDDSPYLRWDLRNEAGVPVASGIYIVHVEAPGIGSKVLKVVVFQRGEIEILLKLSRRLSLAPGLRS